MDIFWQAHHGRLCLEMLITNRASTGKSALQILRAWPAPKALLINTTASSQAFAL
jgi:hypothetical protein